MSCTVSLGDLYSSIPDRQIKVIAFHQEHNFWKEAKQVWGAKEAMDGEGGAEYTRDPALLSPNDPHQSTSTNTQTHTEKHKTHWVTATNKHHPAHKHTTSPETVEDK